MQDKEALPVPDIARDPMMILIGISVLCGEHMLALLDNGLSVVGMADMKVYTDQESLGGVPPREYYAAIQHDLLVGTVEALTASVSQSLTKVWETMAGKRPDGGYDVIPMLGEASLRKQTAVLSRFFENSEDKTTVRKLLALPPYVTNVQSDMRARAAGFKFAQPAVLREHLSRLCLWVDLLNGKERTSDLSDPGLPEDDAVRRLIADLTAYADDNEAYRRAVAEKVEVN